MNHFERHTSPALSMGEDVRYFTLQLDKRSVRIPKPGRKNILTTIQHRVAIILQPSLKICIQQSASIILQPSLSSQHPQSIYFNRKSHNTIGEAPTTSIPSRINLPILQRLPMVCTRWQVSDGSESFRRFGKFPKHGAVVSSENVKITWPPDWTMIGDIFRVRIWLVSF